MNASGYNPLRWDCEKKGCFNKKCRPKIEEFAECFPRACNFGDVDGLVELGGLFCLLEWKHTNWNGELSGGQRKTYVAFTKFVGNVVFVVKGDAETMAVQGYQMFWCGKKKSFIECDLGGLKLRFREWGEYAEKAKKL